MLGCAAILFHVGNLAPFSAMVVLIRVTYSLCQQAPILLWTASLNYDPGSLKIDSCSPGCISSLLYIHSFKLGQFAAGMRKLVPILELIPIHYGAHSNKISVFSVL